MISNMVSNCSSLSPLVFNVRASIKKGGCWNEPQSIFVHASEKNPAVWLNSVCFSISCLASANICPSPCEQTDRLQNPEAAVAAGGRLRARRCCDGQAERRDGTPRAARRGGRDGPRTGSMPEDPCGSCKKTGHIVPVRGSGFWVVAVPGVSTPSPTLIPPASLHRGFHSASSLFLVLQPRSASFSVFSIIPRNTFIFSMVLLRLAAISSCTRREQGRTVALGTAFC